MTSPTRGIKTRLVRDAVILIVSVALAYLLSTAGFFRDFFLVNPQSEMVGLVIAGVLFTSLFTTPIAIGIFASMASSVHPVVMGLVGAAGAVFGDLALFGLVRFAFQKDVEYLLSIPKHRRLFAVFHRRMFRWLWPFIGAIVIASPLPDELGVALMGISKVRTKTLIAISYVMNAVGITLIALAY